MSTNSAPICPACHTSQLASWKCRKLHPRTSAATSSPPTSQLLISDVESSEDIARFYHFNDERFHWIRAPEEEGEKQILNALRLLLYSMTHEALSLWGMMMLMFPLFYFDPTSRHFHCPSVCCCWRKQRKLAEKRTWFTV